MQGKFKPGDTVYDRGGSRKGRVTRQVGPGKFHIQFQGGQAGVFAAGQLYSESEFKERGSKR